MDLNQHPLDEIDIKIKLAFLLLELELVKQILTFWKSRQVGPTLKVGN
jgi:hypothetical protein